MIARKHWLNCADLMFKAAIYLLAWFAFLIASVSFAARFAPVANHAILMLAALSPYLAIVAGLAALWLLLAQRTWLAIGPAILVAAVVATQMPLFIGSGRPAANSVAIRVLTVNAHDGAADPEALVAAAREHADLVVVQELSPDLAAAVSRLGLESEFPHTAIDAQPHAVGIGLWSRYPISQPSRDSRYELGVVTASLKVPGVSSDTVVAAVHLVGPWPQPIDGWRAEIAKLPDTLRALAKEAGSGAVVIAGDFNATLDMQPFRRLLRDGFRDAADQSGAGLVRTFAADRAVPPLLGIDHVLTFNSSAGDLRTVRIPGSDHLGLTATISLPT